LQCCRVNCFPVIESICEKLRAPPIPALPTDCSQESVAECPGADRRVRILDDERHAGHRGPRVFSFGAASGLNGLGEEILLAAKGVCDKKIRWTETKAPKCSGLQSGSHGKISTLHVFFECRVFEALQPMPWRQLGLGEGPPSHPPGRPWPGGAASHLPFPHRFHTTHSQFS